MLIHQALYFR